MTSLRKTTFAATSLAFIAIGTLAGCTTAADTTVDDVTTGGGSSESGSASDTPYADGTYEASGSYQSPNGTESVDVTITLEGDVITDVEVVGHGESPDSKRYQGEFIDGIADEVVGVDIDDISVDRVGGSSLTSGGFNQAVADIKEQAVA
ncbi:MAG: FMN-binding protein [Aeromicrobium sp.]